jgi:hypothetical protein
MQNLYELLCVWKHQLPSGVFYITITILYYIFKILL